ncbi:hypothetical protein [Cellulosimicrobium sp. NPDC055967]|uniref:hypothetical protein n=1 Tax=Cellulosimicrobium sp. NPDC055967 TaxID=3345670 RepID=UPI0035DF7538
MIDSTAGGADSVGEVRLVSDGDGLAVVENLTAAERFLAAAERMPAGPSELQP